MKKPTLLLLILIIGLSVAFSQSNHTFFNRELRENNRKFYKEKNIRAFVEYTYNYNKGSKDDMVIHYKIVNFDSSGNRISEAEFDQKKKFEKLTKYMYNEMNEEIMSFYMEEGRLLYKTNFYYDLNNELIESIVKTEFGSIHKRTTNYYNSDNLLNKFITIGPSGNLLYEGKLSYIENKYPSQCKMINNNALVSEYKFNYNKNRIIEEHFSEAESKNNASYNFFYTEDFIDSTFMTYKNQEFILKRDYFTFEDKLKTIEESLIIPDFSKYFKTDQNSMQKFVFETPPEFPGGKQALISYVNDNLKYPKKALKAGIQGLVIVSFVIDATGSLGNIRIQKGVDYELDNAAIELVNKMPKWKPASNSKGKETISSFELPVNFVIE